MSGKPRESRPPLPPSPPRSAPSSRSALSPADPFADSPSPRPRRGGAAADSSRGAGLTPAARPSALIDTRVIYCGDCLERLKSLPEGCVDLVYIDPPFNSNRNYEVFWGETKEKRAFEDRSNRQSDIFTPLCIR